MSSSVQADSSTAYETTPCPDVVTSQLAKREDRPARTHRQRLRDVIQSVCSEIAPVWPLKDFVAVNPYLGLTDRNFLMARQQLRSVCDCETLMPVSYYRQRFLDGVLLLPDIQAAVDEINSDDSLSRLRVDDVVKLLEAGDSASAEFTSDARKIRTLAERIDQKDGTAWTAVIREEIGRHCAAHYDEGQATVASPWKSLPLFEAWRSAAVIDRRLEVLGVSGCRRLFAELPRNAESAVAFLLQRLQLPEAVCQPFLLCQALSVPGWSSWTKYKADKQQDATSDHDLLGLLAIRLAYDVAIAESCSMQIDWTPVLKVWNSADRFPARSSSVNALFRFALMRASEIAFQRQLLNSLEVVSTDDDASSTATVDTDVSSDLLAQMVFCIDVRSERFRRNLEHVGPDVQTFGFAGFFGMPIAFHGVGEELPTPQLPALLSPSFTVSEGVRNARLDDVTLTSRRRGMKRRLRKNWKRFQSSASSCFGFVETSGLLFGWKLFIKSINRASAINSKFDGVLKRDRNRLGPLLGTLEDIGIGDDQQVDLAESALRGIGLTAGFAGLVVLCGHASQTRNNPLEAGLDCGACCGHSGEPNARFAAALLNTPGVRAGLAERGIEVPESTHFLAAVHNTTSDVITFFDTDTLPPALQDSLSQLKQNTTQATSLTQVERLPHLNAANAASLLQRTVDWSEVRPEWGLAGNATFVVAPRHVTKQANLDGRCFLHSYNHNSDVGFRILEQIMTAPMVVAHWINMQYFASTVDNRHYGSGSKTIHNVVGRFGVFSGNGGDLTTGLPWQSIHNGTEFQHEPLRLLAVIAAPKSAVKKIIERHKMLEDLLINSWMNLVVIDGGQFYRYTTKQNWQLVQSNVISPNDHSKIVT